MRIIILKVLFLILIAVLIGCTAMSGGLKNLVEPEGEKVIVMGTVLIENIDMDFPFDYWEYPLQVVVMGVDEKGEKHYFTARTDRSGYYCIPNLPKGSYTLKAVIFQFPGERPDIITNKWEYIDSNFYLMRHPERGVEYTAKIFPNKPEGRIVNQHIYWFGLRKSVLKDRSVFSVGNVMVNGYDRDLKNERLMTNGYPYTRLEPLTYFKSKFPDSGWWKEVIE